MKSYRKELWFNTSRRREYLNLTPDINQCLAESGVREGLCLVNAMHITASVFINDDEAGLHQDFETGKSISAWNGDVLLKPYEKVIMDTEYLWKTGELMPPGLSRFVGDEDVLSPAIDSGSGPVAWYWKQCIDGHRDLGVTSVGIYGGVTGAARRGYQLQTFIMPDLVHHGFSGRTISWKYALLNDLFVPARLVFSWRLTAPVRRIGRALPARLRAALRAVLMRG